MTPADIVLVAACLRDGAGGSPTAVVVDPGGAGDGELTRLPAQAGASHLAAVSAPDRPGGPWRIRFFTVTGELPACGHGTVAAIAVIVARTGAFAGTLRIGGRDLAATGTPGPAGLVEAWFDQGPVVLRAARDDEQAAFLGALDLPAARVSQEEIRVASPGRERLLVPVADRAILASLRPDQDRLADASERHGQLGCFVYVPPTSTAPAAARMFAPAIGVPEDVANANSTGCLAAYLLASGRCAAVAVDQGDALGRPSTVYATAAATAGGLTTRVGGSARLVS